MAFGECGERAAQPVEGALGVGGAAGVDGDGAAALALDGGLDPGAVPDAGRVQDAGEFGLYGGDAGVRGGRVDGAGGGFPALGAVVAEDDEMVQARYAREAAEADRDGRPGGR